MGANMDPTDLVEGFQLNHHYEDPFYFMGFKFSSSCFERMREPLRKKKKGKMYKSTKEVQLPFVSVSPFFFSSIKANPFVF